MFLYYLLLFILSWFVVAFGQPALISWLGIVAAIIGYAIFWRVLLVVKSRYKQFFLGFFWYALVQSVQLSWMLSTEYQGDYVYIVYAILAIAWGVQFGFVSLVLAWKPLSLRRVFVVAALWTLMEWLRVFILSGYWWNPAGMALSGNGYMMQGASLVGVYGLTFWVMLTNLLLLLVWQRRSIKVCWLWVGVAFVPFIFGVCHVMYHTHQMKKWEEPPFSVALVQTGLTLGEKTGLGEHADEFIHPIGQWQRIFSMLNRLHRDDCDLIVLPEVALPYDVYAYIYYLSDVQAALKHVFGDNIESAFPPLKKPFGDDYAGGIVGNAYLAQTLANYFDNALILGIIEINEELREDYNAAFYFTPGDKAPLRYIKRVLVPMGEYIPYEWSRKIAARYGIDYSFTPGKESIVFPGRPSVSTSICYEEMDGNLIRMDRLKGADLFVNITNDYWFPNTLLPVQQAEHARLRTVENGVSLVRSANTGVTMAIDCLGRDIAVLQDDNGHSEWISGVLHVDVPSYNYHTLYTRIGDAPVIAFCIIVIALFICGFMIRPKTR